MPDWASPSRWAGWARLWTTRRPRASNSTLEWELLSRQRFATKVEARRAVAGFIDRYNRLRRHSTCAMRSPIDFEADLAASATDVEEAA